MVFPQSPFTDKLNIETIFTPHKGNIKADQEVYNLPELLEWLCKTPTLTSFRVNTLINNVNTVKEILQDKLKLVAERQGKLDCMPKICTHPLLHDVLLVDSYHREKLFLNKLEQEIIVDASCGAAVLRGANIFAPGIMAIEHCTKVGDKVSIYADISKNCKKGLAKIYDCPQKVFVANGTAEMTRKELFKQEPAIGLAVNITDSLSGCPAISDKNLPLGTVLLQNIPSIVCGHVLNPKSGEIILDMCAAPGNKTSHLANLMQNQGILVALDKTPNKLLSLNKTCEHFGLKCVQTYNFDSTKSCNSDRKGFSVEDGPPFLPESFDKILLDAPCSGLGNRPQLLNTITDTVVKSYVPLQKKLFHNAVNLLKIDGFLVFSTCTITLAENEGIVDWALRKYPNLELVPADPILGGPGWIGTDLNKEQLGFVQRFGPNQSTDSIGFFIAKFRKNYS